MTEHPPQTPDRILRTRTLSDADLLEDGAEYLNGVLKATPNQIETIKARYSSKMGEVATDAAGLVLHRPEYTNLEYLSSDAALENESNLQNKLSDIMTPYEDALRPEFPRKTKLFATSATESHPTSRLIGNKEIKYSVDFTVYKTDDHKSRLVPGKVDVIVDMYGQLRGGDDRDTAHFSYDKDEKIQSISLDTLPLPQYVYAQSDTRGVENVKKQTLGPFREGVAPTIIDMVDSKALPETQVYEADLVDTGYHAYISLVPGHYELQLSRDVGKYPEHPRTLGEDRLNLRGTQTLHYRYNPEKNCFIRMETANDWNIGPDELEVDQFLNVVKAACGNIPTFNSAAGSNA